MMRACVSLVALLSLHPAASVKTTSYPEVVRHMKANPLPPRTDATVKAAQSSISPYGESPAQLTLAMLQKNEDRSKLREPLRERIQKQAKALGHPPVVYFFGDSTVRNQWMAYCSLLNAKPVVPPGDSAMGMFGHKKKKLYQENVCESSEGLGAAALMHTWGTWNGDFPSWGKQRSGASLSSFKFPILGHPDADVIVLGIGHHILQQVSTPWTIGNGLTFMNYEEDYASSLVAMNKAMAGGKRVLQTTGSICEDHFFGAWLITDATAAAKAKPCFNTMRNSGVDVERATFMCEESLFRRNSVMKLNQRLLDANTKQGQGVAVADIFKVTDGQCEKTEDGVHFNEMPFEMLVETFAAAGW